MRTTRARFSLAAAALLFGSTAAMADTARDPVAAEALFRDGRAAIERGDYEAACSRFRESHRLDPAPGTLLNLADCEERRGHLATAWQLFIDAGQQFTAGDARIALAKERAAALDKRLPRLTIRLAPNAPSGTTVQRGEITLGDASLGMALPVDPGEHVIVVNAPGHAPRSYSVRLVESEAREIAVLPGDASASASFGASSSGSSPTLGYVSLAVGAAGIATGVVTSLMVVSKKAAADNNCIEGRCNREGFDAIESARSIAPVSTVSWIVGAVGIGLGGYLILSHDDSGAARTAILPTVGKDTGSVTVMRRF